MIWIAAVLFFASLIGAFITGSMWFAVGAVGAWVLGAGTLLWRMFRGDGSSGTSSDVRVTRGTSDPIDLGGCLLVVVPWVVINLILSGVVYMVAANLWPEHVGVIVLVALFIHAPVSLVVVHAIAAVIETAIIAAAVVKSGGKVSGVLAQRLRERLRPSRMFRRRGSGEERD